MNPDPVKRYPPDAWAEIQASAATPAATPTIAQGLVEGVLPSSSTPPNQAPASGDMSRAAVTSILVMLSALSATRGWPWLMHLTNDPSFVAWLTAALIGVAHFSATMVRQYITGPKVKA